MRDNVSQQLPMLWIAFIYDLSSFVILSKSFMLNHVDGLCFIVPIFHVFPVTVNHQIMNALTLSWSQTLLSSLFIFPFNKYSFICRSRHNYELIKPHFLLPYDIIFVDMQYKSQVLPRKGSTHYSLDIGDLRNAVYRLNFLMKR